jgi:peptide deformylase
LRHGVLPGGHLRPAALHRLDAVTVLPIRLFGDPVLRTPAEPVTVFDKELRQLVADLTETMLDAPGAGLAAPQLGVGLRVFSYWVSEDEQGHLVNPVLHFPSEETQDGPEGCLSIPGLTFDCLRAEHVVAHGQNMYGDPVTIEGTARLSRAIQHETDHLDGVLFIDRLDPETRKAAMAEIRNAEWSGLAAPVVKVSPHGAGALTAARPGALGPFGLRR